MPKLGEASSALDLARGYATLSAAWYTQWTVVFDALSYFEDTMSALRAEIESLRGELAKERRGDKVPSIEDVADRLENAAEKLEEVTSPDLRRTIMTSDRVREMIQSSSNAQKAAEFEAGKAQRAAFPNTVPISGLDDIAQGDVVDLRVRCTTAAGVQIIVVSANFSIKP